MNLHWIRGARGFVLAVVLATAASAAAQSVQPTAPIAINEDIFNGTVKGFLPPDEVLLSTKLSSVAFTGFFRSASASAVAGYVSEPADIPSLQTGRRCAGRRPRPADARAVTGAWRARVTHRVPPVAHNGTPGRARPRRWAGFRRHEAC